MKKDEREQLRHEEYLKRIDEATKVDELPKRITTSVVLSTFLSAIKHKVDKEKAKVLVDKLLSNMEYLLSPEYEAGVYNLLKENNHLSDDEIRTIFKELLVNRRIFNLISESNKWDYKNNNLTYAEATEKHDKVMKKIGISFEIEDLPKVSVSSITRQINLLLYDLFKKEKLKAEYVSSISKNLVKGYKFDDIEIKKCIEKLCRNKEMIESYNSLSIEEKVNCVTSILESNYLLNYIVEEVIAKESRVLFIYRVEHEDIMDQIEAATRIRELPGNISISKITGYLSGNSLISTKGTVVSSTDFIPIASLLLEGHNFYDIEVISELEKIVYNRYCNEPVENPFELLFNKLSKLPRLDYYVEEVRRTIERQNEFILRGSSNVNVYVVPNPKSPKDGGKFYNLYISSAQNLNLEEILPLDLNEIIKNVKDDIDAVEWYVRDKYDKSFKLVGGLILNKDETIGNINVFRPSDGRPSIDPEEKKNYEQLEDLSKKLKEITDKSKKAKEEYLKSQEAIDEEISSIQTEITSLIDQNEKKKKKVYKNQNN